MSSTFTIEPGWPTMLELARELWGAPNLKLSKRDRSEVRFGSNGSKSVKPQEGVWHDHETGNGGGYLELHRTVKGSPPPGSKPNTRRKFKPPQMPPSDNNDRVYDWFGRRHIGAKTVVDFGIHACEWNFPKGIGRRPAIAFPFRYQGELHSVKYRTFGEPRSISQDCPGDNILFNADAIDNAETLYWVEGETDVLTLYECGYRNVVSLRDGASGFGSIAAHEEKLSKIKRHILAGDMDAAGLKWRDQLAHRFGRAKCAFVTWPDGCKDANETLCSDGGSPAMTEALERAEPYPIKGAYPLKDDEFEQWFAATDPPTMTTGCLATDRIVKLPTDGRLIVVTGFANHGKSTWARFLAVHTALKHERRWMIYSSENRRDTVLRRCAEVYIGKRFKAEHVAQMDRADRDRARDFLQERIIPAVCDAKEDTPTVDWVMEVAEGCVMRHGVTDILIDPWNTLDHGKKGDQTEAAYIGRSLQRLVAFAEQHQVNVWICAHPTKALATGNEKRMVGGYDISGSAAWNDKADLGLTVEKQDDGHSKIFLWKSREAEVWLTSGGVARVWFNQHNGRFMEPLSASDTPEPPPTKQWQRDD